MRIKCNVNIIPLFILLKEEHRDKHSESSSSTEEATSATRFVKCFMRALDENQIAGAAAIDFYRDN